MSNRSVLAGVANATVGRATESHQAKSEFWTLRSSAAQTFPTSAPPIVAKLAAARQQAVLPIPQPRQFHPSSELDALRA